MRVPPWQRHVVWTRHFLFFFLGMIFGAILMVLYLGVELDQLYTQQRSLTNEIISLENKMKTLEKEKKIWGQPKKVTDIIIHLEGAPNGLMEAEIQRLALQDTNFLMGKEINSLEETYESLFQIFANRIYLIESQKVEIQLEHLVISSKVHFYLRVKK